MTGSDGYGSEVPHEPGQRHGLAESCDYEDCDCTSFDLVRDNLTDERLVVCQNCGFTLGWLA